MEAGPRPDRIDDLISGIQQKFGNVRANGTRRYTDEPIIQRGGDFVRSRPDKPAAAAPDAGHARRGRLIEASLSVDLTGEGTFERFFPEDARYVNGSAGTHDADERPWPPAMPDGSLKSRREAGAIPRAPKAPPFRPARGFVHASWRPDGRIAGMPEQEEPTRRLPETLEKLRALQRQGRRSSRSALFLKQAELAADYEETEDLREPDWRMLAQPVYESLTDRELRCYFRWRTLWRTKKQGSIPGWCGALYAYEILSGVHGFTPDETLAELAAMSGSCESSVSGQMSATTIQRLRKEYAVYHGIEPEKILTERQRELCRHVCRLRQEQNAIFADQGWDIPDPELPATHLDRKALFDSFVAVSTFKPEKSPLVRAMPDRYEEAAYTLFRTMAEHCHRRRSTNFVDGVAGLPSQSMEMPYAFTPVTSAFEGSARYEIAPGADLTLDAGVWILRIPFALSFKPDRGLTRLLRELDRQLRDAYGFGHPLKKQDIPPFEIRYTSQAVEALMAREEAERKAAEEAERRRFRVDLSKIGSIREAAAQTQEALLVDEEREGYVPSVPEAGPDPVPAPAPEEKAPVPPAGKPAPSGALPFGLDEHEYALARALLDHEDPSSILSGAPVTLDMLVDSMNEKLYDLNGDVSFEFDGDDVVPIEDYEEDLRKALSDGR